MSKKIECKNSCLAEIGRGKLLTLADFDQVTGWGKSGDKCKFCNERVNNGTFTLCSSHTDTLRKLKRAESERLYNIRLEAVGIDFDQLEDLDIDGIDHRDAPDYCDAFICSGYQNGVELTDAQLDFLNDDADFVYQLVIDQIE